MKILGLNDFDYEIKNNELIFKKLSNNNCEYHTEHDFTLLDKYNINGKDLPVTKIEDGAFAFSSIRRLILPDTIKEIGRLSFAFTNLNNFVLPSKIEKIPSDCFYFCYQLENINIGNNIKSIGSGAFSCSNIKHFEFPDNIKKIPSLCFFNCKNLEKITINKHEIFGEELKKIKTAYY